VKTASSSRDRTIEAVLVPNSAKTGSKGTHQKQSSSQYQFEINEGKKISNYSCLS
jgi:hypothetical protein